MVVISPEAITMRVYMVPAKVSVHQISHKVEHLRVVWDRTANTNLVDILNESTMLPGAVWIGLCGEIFRLLS